MNGEPNSGIGGLHTIYHNNAVLMVNFLTHVKILYTRLEKEYPFLDVVDPIAQNITKEVIELGIQMELFDISMRNHDLTHYRTLFIIVESLFQQGFFEDTNSLHTEIFHLLQKYSSLINSDGEKIQNIQKKYVKSISSALFYEEIDYICSFCEQEIEFFLSSIHSQEYFLEQKKRYHTFLLFLQENEIISIDECSNYLKEESLKGFYELTFSLLEKNIWTDESSLKQLIGEELRDYFYNKDESRYESLSEYEVGFEQGIQKWANKILLLSMTQKIHDNIQDIDDFLNYLFTHEIITQEDFQMHISSQDMIATLCDIFSNTIILGKYISSEPELEEKWLTFLIGYYTPSQNKNILKLLRNYAHMCDYHIPTNGENIPQSSSFDIQAFQQDSENFHHFLNVAMDIPNRILNSDSRDFFEGEKEFLLILEGFQKTGFITEDYFYELQEYAFEVSIYKLLKHIYYQGLFSGDINLVEKIRDTLLRIAELVCKEDIGEIREYFNIRYTALISKEKKAHIIPFCQQVIEILKDGGEVKEQSIIWDFVNFTSKYDTSGNIIKLHGYGNNPRIAAYECLYFMLTHNFLNDTGGLLASTYNMLKGYYIANNIQSRVGELRTFSDTLKISQPHLIINLEKAQSQEVLSRFRILLSFIEMGFYSNGGEKILEQFVHYLWSEGIISTKEKDIIFRTKQESAGFFNLYHFLQEKGYFKIDQKIQDRVEESKKVYSTILDEKENLDIEDLDVIQILPNFDEKGFVPIQCSFIDWIKDDEILTLQDEFFQEFIGYLGSISQGDSAYSEIFGEEPETIIDISDKDERTHALLLYIFCDFLDEDYDTMHEVHMSLKEYYFNNPEICVIINDIIHPYSLLHQKK